MNSVRRISPGWIAGRRCCDLATFSVRRADDHFYSTGRRSDRRRYSIHAIAKLKWATRPQEGLAYRMTRKYGNMAP
jgi:hypothetical protein